MLSRIPYLRRFLLSGRLALGELAFAAGVVIISVGALNAVRPEFDRLSIALSAWARVLAYWLCFIALVAFQYNERVRRVLVEGKAATAALRPILDSITELPLFRDDATVRANVMVMSAPDRLRVEFRSARMIGHADGELEVRLDQGNAGPAISRGKTRATNQADRGLFHLEPEQLAATRELRTIISIPIRDPRDPENVIGVLNVDSEVRYPLEDPSFKGTVSALESQAQGIGPLLELTGRVWYRHRIRGQIFPGLA